MFIIILHNLQLVKNLHILNIYRIRGFLFEDKI